MINHTCNEGDIVVRISSANNINKEFSKIGTIFRVVKGDTSFRAHYTSIAGVPKGSWRPATENEIKYFSTGTTNIKDIYSKDPNFFDKNNFAVNIRKNEPATREYREERYKKYYDICSVLFPEKNPMSISAKGGYVYYGIIEGKYNSSAYHNTVFNHITRFESIEHFEVAVNKLLILNKENKYETKGFIKQVNGSLRKGTSCKSSSSRQVTIGVRPTGHTTIAKYRKTRVVSAKISFISISI